MELGFGGACCWGILGGGGISIVGAEDAACWISGGVSGPSWYVSSSSTELGS